jgi:hypothetical protein
LINQPARVEMHFIAAGLLLQSFERKTR